MKIDEKEFVEDQLRELSPDSIKVWDDSLDENFTINVELDKPEWRRLYEKLEYEFAKDGSGLYFYPFERLHMTILGRIDKSVDVSEIVRIIKETMAGKSFGFKIGYLANNNQAISIISDPDFDLAELRAHLRVGLDIEDDLTKYSNVYESLAWINFIRFKEIPGYKFFETLWRMREYQFGNFEVKSVCLYLNSSKTLDPAKSRLIEKIEIS